MFACLMLCNKVLKDISGGVRLVHYTTQHKLVPLHMSSYMNRDPHNHAHCEDCAVCASALIRQRGRIPLSLE